MALMLVGCGTSVPEIQDIGDSAAGQQLVQAIVTNITCEVQDGINRIYKHRHSTFLDSWGVQIMLNLTIEEKGSVSPSLNYFPTTMFVLGANGSVSSDATRTDKLNSYYTVKELLRLGPCGPTDRAHGTLLRADDLKLTEWLFDNVTASDTGEVRYGADLKGPFGQNVISHEVKFEVVLSGDITPGWLLKYVSINPTVPFLSARRDKTHDLIITLGPTDPSGTAPSPAAANAALASDIGVAVGNNVRSLRAQ
ncbi:MAG TPA: hypothetical protein VGI78_17500 [Acetobacteraceae bacterium]|jgi:hypothetical protein